MAMLTTCPACRTRFRVTPEQLGAHRGDVRCGRCAKVFDAHAYLEHEPEELEPEVLEPEEESGVQVESAAESALPPEEETPPQVVVVEESLPEDLPEPQLPISPHDEEVVVEIFEPFEHETGMLPEAVAPIPAEPAVVAEAIVPVGPEAIPENPVEQPSPAKVVHKEIPVSEEEAPKKRSLFWLWLLGSIFLLVSLGGQGLYFFRSDLASRYPGFKPFLQQYCSVLQCTIRLPANPDMLSIETSNLEADPNQANLVVLNAILRNRAKVAQEYPLLELTLTDTQDKMIARRIFPPKEYAKNADLNRGMPPNEEVTVKLHLDLGDLKAVGYRVFLFYPQ